jgi:hypothetical protein
VQLNCHSVHGLDFCDVLLKTTREMTISEIVGSTDGREYCLVPGSVGQQAAAARLKPPKYAGIEVRVGIWTQVSSHGPPRTRDLERDDLSVELLSLFNQTGHKKKALALVAITETSALGRQRSSGARTQRVRLTWLWGAAGGLRDLQSELEFCWKRLLLV